LQQQNLEEKHACTMGTFESTNIKLHSLRTVERIPWT